MKREISTLDMSTSRNKMKKLLSTLLVMAAVQVWAQQNPTTDNYLFNPVSISPAYAGQQNGQLQSIYDAQWIGLKGAPRTGSMYYDYMAPSRFAFNIGLIDDQVGPLHMQNLGISTAYHLQVAKETYFSVGIRYTLNHTTVDLVDEFYVDKIDQSIYDIDGPWFQNVDLGGTLYQENWYIGGTMKNMVRQEMYDANFTARIGHLFGGYRFGLNDYWTLNPSILLNFTENAPMDANLHVFAEYKSYIGGGLNLSPGDEFGMFFKTKLAGGYHLFYQYNYPLSDLVYVTKQSHVIGVGIDFIRDAKTIVSPRYFL